MKKEKKKLTPWIKGGIIGAILGLFSPIIVLLVGVIIGVILEPFLGDEGSAWFGLSLFYLPSIFLINIFGGTNASGILSFVFWFFIFTIMGILFGWIIGKRKSRIQAQESLKRKIILIKNK